MDDSARLERALASLPIFPLPGAVLLPHSLVPLHVFEPRYRKMTKDCQAGLKLMGLANVPREEDMTNDRPEVSRVIGVGVLARVEQLQDGRFNVVLRGLSRARIRRELQSGEPYRLVEADELAADPAQAGEPRVIAAAQALQQMVLSLSRARRSRELSALAQLVARATDPGDVADLTAGALLADADERQHVLEAVDLVERLELATEAAADALAQSPTSSATPN